MLPAGKYKAKIHNYGVKPVKTGENKGKPAATISFIVTTKEGYEKVYWQGSLTDKARDITLTALYYCGMTIDSFKKLALGPVGKALDVSKELEIDVVNEEYNGQKHAKVKWINAVGGKKFEEAMSSDDFCIHLDAMGLQGHFAEIARKLDSAPKEAKEELAPEFDPIDVPF